MNKKLIFILLSILVVVAVGAVLYVFVFAQDNEKAPVCAELVIDEPFITNTAGNHSIFKVGVTLVLNTDNARVMEQMKAKTPQIRDTIITVLRVMSAETLSSSGGLSELKDRLIEALNENIMDEKGQPLDVVQGIYFTDYYIQ